MIELLGVDKRRGDRTILRGVDLSLAAGELLLITGPTGSGKSTLCRLLTGELAADAGRVSVFGHDLARLSRRSLALLRRRIGVVPQDLRLVADRSALDNVALALEVKGAPRRHALGRAVDLLTDVGFRGEPRTPAGALSPGEQQLVAIARALVREPALLILDQPTAHLDGSAAAGLVALMAGRTGLVASNDGELLAAAGYRGWRVVELRDGGLRELSAGQAAAEPAVATEPAAAAGSIDVTEGPDLAVDEADIQEEIANVVPFPVTARAGGFDK